MARILDEVRGHKLQIERFLDAYRQKRLPSTFLLVGPSGIGKRKVAWGLSQALLCDASERGCGQCASCLRVEKQSSESVLFVAPQGAQIKVEQGREVLEFLSLKRLARARVVIFDQAHLLNVQAGNALLKTLEEPPEETYFFLITHSQSGLLPTIRSRTQTMRFSPLAAEELRQLVEVPEWVISSSQGRIDLAQTLGDESWAEVGALALQVLTRALQGKSAEAEAIKDLIKDKSTALFTILIWQKLLRDVCVSQAGSQDFVNVDHAEMIASFAERDHGAMVRLLQLALELEAPVTGNVDRTLVVETFLIKARKLSQLKEEEAILYGMD